MKVSFSIIIPTRDRYKSGLLDQAITSVLNQVGDNFNSEIIIIDDATTGGMPKNFLEKYGKQKIRYIYIRKCVGTPHAIKEGIKAATGDYIVILGDDDLLPKDSLNKRANFIEKNPNLDWFYGKTQLLNSGGRPIKTISQSESFEDHHYARMFLYNYIQGGTTTVKKSVYDKIEWPTWLKSRDDDFIAFELVRPDRYDFKFMDEVVYGYRSHNIDERQSVKNLNNKKELSEIDRKIRYELHDSELAFLAEKAKKSAFLEKELEEREIRLDLIYSSFFWKITAPIRKIKKFISK